MPNHLTSPAFTDFVAPARPKAELWRTLVGLTLIVGFYLIFLFIVFAGLAIDTRFDMTPRIEIGGFLGGFIGATIAVWLVLRFLHRRSFASMIGPLRPALRHFAIGAGVVFAVQVASLLLWSVPFDAVVQRSIASVLMTLPVLVLLVLIQTSAEEFVFRGYLMQQLAARFAAPWVWLLVPQLLFAVLHYDPVTMGDLAWPVVAIIFVYALLWADLTRITGNIGAACGWHFANNLLLFAWISPPDDLAAFAWAVTPYSIADTPPWAIGADLLISLICWAILRRALLR